VQDDQVQITCAYEVQALEFKSGAGQIRHSCTNDILHNASRTTQYTVYFDRIGRHKK